LKNLTAALLALTKKAKNASLVLALEMNSAGEKKDVKQSCKFLLIYE